MKTTRTTTEHSVLLGCVDPFGHCISKSTDRTRGSLGKGCVRVGRGIMYNGGVGG
jgi:hypothetical protein